MKHLSLYLLAAVSGCAVQTSPESDLLAEKEETLAATIPACEKNRVIELAGTCQHINYYSWSPTQYYYTGNVTGTLKLYLESSNSGDAYTVITYLDLLSPDLVKIGTKSDSEFDVLTGRRATISLNSWTGDMLYLSGSTPSKSAKLYVRLTNTGNFFVVKSTSTECTFDMGQLTDTVCPGETCSLAPTRPVCENSNTQVNWMGPSYLTMGMMAEEEQQCFETVTTLKCNGGCFNGAYQQYGTCPSGQKVKTGSNYCSY